MDKIAIQTDVYDRDQLEQLKLGLLHGVDVTVYQNPAYMALQMEWIRKGLEEKLNVSLYADPAFDWFQMEEIYKGLKVELDVSKYRNPAIPYDRMREIRKGLLQGVDLSPFGKFGSKELRELRHALRRNIHIVKYMVEGYDSEQLEVITGALAEGIDIDPYLSREYRGVALNEILLGLRKNLKVETYAGTNYSWQQMREIREGLEERLDVDQYSNWFYSAGQMHEIRLGLEYGLDVTAYRSLMYTAKDMRKKRLALIAELTGGSSIPMVPGTDGYHEYLFDREKTGTLCLLENGAADFTASYRFPLCKANDVIAVYHEATWGRNGMSREGRVIRATKGKEKRVLTGDGVRYDEKYKTYVASKAGWVYLDEERDLLEVRQAVTLDNITPAMGRVVMTGNLEVFGNIATGSALELDGDLIVDGHVEEAEIKCTGSIMIRGGINGNDKGIVRAGGSLTCMYVENCEVCAEGDVRTDYIFSGRIESKGQVVVLGSRGSVIGSRIQAEKGIRCRRAGNEARAYTELKIVYPKLDEKFETALAEGKANATRELELLMQARERFRLKYSAEQRNNNKDFLKLEKAIYTKNLELKEIEGGYMQLKEMKKQLVKGRIIVEERICEGVVFEMDKCRYESGGKLGRAMISERNGRISVEDD